VPAARNLATGFLLPVASFFSDRQCEDWIYSFLGTRAVVSAAACRKIRLRRTHSFQTTGITMPFDYDKPLGKLPAEDTLHYDFLVAVMLGERAGELAKALANHQHGANPSLHAHLSRLQNCLRDASTGVRDAVASLSPATVAAIKSR
jgi:hypothetical protein